MVTWWKILGTFQPRPTSYESGFEGGEGDSRFEGLAALEAASFKETGSANRTHLTPPERHDHSSLGSQTS